MLPRTAIYPFELFLTAACMVFVVPVVQKVCDPQQLSALASEGGGNSGPGGGDSGGGGNSGPGGGGGDDGDDHSGPGGGGGEDDHSGAGNGNRGTTERDGVARYLDALHRHGKVSAVQSSGTSISVTYADGWRESVNGNRYRLFDNRGRRVVDRPARRSDLARLRSVAP